MILSPCCMQIILLGALGKHEIKRWAICPPQNLQTGRKIKHSNHWATRKKVVSTIGIWKKMAGYRRRKDCFQPGEGFVEKVNWAPRISKYGINWGRKCGKFWPTRLRTESKDRGTPTLTGCLPPAKCSGCHLILIMTTQGGFFLKMRKPEFKVFY